MSIPSSPPPMTAAIPESLRRQLEDFRRRLWRIKVAESVAAGVIGLVFSFLLVFGLDRIWQTPGLVRLAILIAGTSMFAGFAPYWLHRWVWGHRRENQLARLIARRYPGLGDRLLGVIELQHQQGSADSLSPRLREAAMQAVAVETGRRSLDQALPPSRHRVWSLAAILLLASSATVMMLAPKAGLNALQRWLMPLSDTERYTFTRLVDAPDFMAVPFGEAFDVSLRLSGNSEQRPIAATARYGMQPEVATTLAGDIYQFTFPGQQAPGTVVFRIGDLRHEMRVQPVQRPATERIIAVITPPEYLQLPAREQEFNTGVISAVEGSTIGIELQTNRPLVTATYGPTRAQTAEEGEPETSAPSLSGELEIKGRSAKTPPLPVSAQSYEIPFEWTDEFGLRGDSAFLLRVDGRKDAAPGVYLQGIERQSVMLPDETLDLEVLAEDDFGLKHIGLEWNGEFTRPTDEVAARGELPLGEGMPSARRMLEAAAFSPLAFGISPQKILLRAFAEDYLPDRGRVYSEPVVIYVLTRDEHKQLLQSRFDRNIGELEDIARNELQLYDENQRLERLEGEELQGEENRKRLDAQEQAEAENTRRMEALTERMEELLKDSVRNGEIDKETLQKMADALKSMQELSKEDMPKVTEKLGDSQQPSNTPEKTGEDVKEAVEEQKKVVEKMQEAVEKANDAKSRFEAGTFVNRLKKAASEQNGIASSLIEAFAELLGAKPTDLDPAVSRKLSEATGQQSDTASEVRWIQEDLGHYFARTQNPIFQDIYEEMRESRIDVGLEDVRTQLLANHAYLATESSRKWADLLNEWAAKLDDEIKKSGGGGEGGGSPSPEDEDFEFMLRVMQMVQQQQDLRARTRALEQFRRTAIPEINP
jgi:hypothetical protein